MVTWPIRVYGNDLSPLAQGTFCAAHAHVRYRQVARISVRESKVSLNNKDIAKAYRAGKERIQDEMRKNCLSRRPHIR